MGPQGKSVSNTAGGPAELHRRWPQYSAAVRLELSKAKQRLSKGLLCESLFCAQSRWGGLGASFGSRAVCFQSASLAAAVPSSASGGGV